VAGVAHGLVVEGVDPAEEAVTQRAQSARGVERLVGHAVQGERLQLFERWHLAQLAVDDGFAGVAVLVDEPVGRPGQVVFEGVGRELGQGTDPHGHRTYLIERAGQRGRDHRHEP
jgi:hypothetical protein